MACNEWAERLSAYVDNELLSADRGLVESHLAGCPECAKAVEGLRRLSGLVRSLPHVAAPAGLLESVRAAVAPPPQGRLVRFLARNRAWVSSAAALVATMLVVYGFYSPSRNQFPPAPETSGTTASSGETYEERESYRTTLEHDKAVAMGEQPELRATKPFEPPAQPSGGAVAKMPTAPQPEKPTQKEADDPADLSPKEGGGLAAGTPAADSATPVAPAPPGAATPPQDPAKAREKAGEGLAQDFLSSGSAVTMTCADADDAERKVTRLLRDLRVAYRLQENHTTHVVAEIPADRTEEVLLALEMLEPRRFGWRVPASAHDEASKKDQGQSDHAEAESRSSGKGAAAMEGEEARRSFERRGYLAEDLLAQTNEDRVERKEKALADRDQKRSEAGSMTLVISLEAQPEAEKGR